MEELVCYRAADYRTPVRVLPHRDNQAGRYHEPLSAPVQYLALHPLGPWAEMVRNRRLTDPQEARELRLPVWALRLELEEEPQALDFDAADRGEAPIHISPEELVSDDQAPCQAFAAEVQRDQSLPRIWRVPSAALPGTENLIIFGPRRMISYQSRPRRAQQVPASMTADDGRPPINLLPLVRQYGAAHAGYDAWDAGDTYRLPIVEWAPPPDP